MAAGRHPLHPGLNLVGVLDDGGWLDRVDEPIYLSGLYEMRGNNLDGTSYIAREAQLLAAALTLSPSLRPVGA